MKKIILKKHSEVQFYNIEKKYTFNCPELYNVHLALNPFDDSWIECEVAKDTNEVCIYSNEDIKDLADVEFATEEELDRFYDQFYEYHDKRWKEMPKIVLTIANWEQLQEKWKQIKHEQPKYVFFTLEKEKNLDKVDLYGKNELSEEDKIYIKKEHQLYLKYQQAYQKYLDNHPDHSDVWRGPQDNEYEADIMKYYEK